jgi:hypothetical protein
MKSTCFFPGVAVNDRLAFDFVDEVIVSLILMFATSKVGALEFLNDAWLFSGLISYFSNWSSVL